MKPHSMLLLISMAFFTGCGSKTVPSSQSGQDQPTTKSEQVKEHRLWITVTSKVHDMISLAGFSKEKLMPELVKFSDRKNIRQIGTFPELATVNGSPSLIYVIDHVQDIQGIYKAIAQLSEKDITVNIAIDESKDRIIKIRAQFPDGARIENRDKVSQKTVELLSSVLEKPTVIFHSAAESSYVDFLIKSDSKRSAEEIIRDLKQAIIEVEFSVVAP